MENQNQTFDFSEKRSDKAALAGGAVAGAGTVALVAATPARADGVADVTAMVSSLGGLATAALAVAIVPIGVYFAIRIVKRVMNA